jgi:hypothetical protein
MTEVKDKDRRSDKPDMEKPFNIEERIGRVEGVLDQVKERLNHVETGMSDLRKEITANISDLRNHVDAGLSDLRNHVDTELSGVRGEIGELRRGMDSRFTWLIGIMIIEGILILLTILFKVP